MYTLRVAVAAALAMVAGSAVATPGSGFARTGISDGRYGALDVKADKVDKWDLLIKSKDDTDVAVDRLTVAPGGQSGWHAHPAPIFVTVTVGQIVWYDGSDPLCTSRTYVAGDAFIEGAYRVHLVRNTSAVEAQFTAVRLAPTGVPVRIDVPAVPTNCAF